MAGISSVGCLPAVAGEVGSSLPTEKTVPGGSCACRDSCSGICQHRICCHLLSRPRGFKPQRSTCDRWQTAHRKPGNPPNGAANSITPPLKTPAVNGTPPVSPHREQLNRVDLVNQPRQSLHEPSGVDQAAGNQSPRDSSPRTRLEDFDSVNPMGIR